MWGNVDEFLTSSSDSFIETDTELISSCDESVLSDIEENTSTEIQGNNGISYTTNIADKHKTESNIQTAVNLLREVWLN
jgi:hypothetical protein